MVKRFGRMIKLEKIYKMVILIDLIYIVLGWLLCVDVLFLMYFDVVFIGMVNFCIMLFIFFCSFC